MASKHILTKTEQRASIKIRTVLGDKPLQIHENLVTVYHGETLLYPTVKEWARKLKAGRGSIEDDPRTGKPISSTTPEIDSQILELLDISPQMSVEEIALILDISSGGVHTIWHDYLE
ncbi:hypothetical protein LOD99_1844 [Oopsacas minuta]|uniref:Uncharacterized protein n=1 Tax=Oopsacas minuta TaxID=111878 RepID=A0AAV7K4R4_9METZ|nr:hypothetical protein LOD99_1844 [Oopsacas minuta]